MYILYLLILYLFVLNEFVLLAFTRLDAVEVYKLPCFVPRGF